MDSEKDKMSMEAVVLMEQLGFDKKTLILFEQTGKVLMSVMGSPPGELTGKERDLIADFERGEFKVYHVVKGGVDGVGYTTNLLFVGRFEEDYPLLEYQAERNKLVMAYVYNHTYPEKSESGFIRLKMKPFITRTE